ncbi:MAG: thioredoxin domain-containing protein [Candidatus Melainabacteria bacterium]|nr:thioredoxin domain-containing protein [Candidatus Melainabacteria bacterium]MBI3308658.1 thioredoxin domain-containing protein [Candidatus Melainabacteria bacterium]
MDTRKLIIIGIVAIVGLNLLSEGNGESSGSGNFEQKVIEAIKNNPDAIKAALKVTPPAEDAKPSEDDQFKQQLADKADVNIGETPILGRKNAPITLIVFSDFQCPFSKRGFDTAKALISKYGDKMSYIYKHLPLSFHPQAEPAAKACVAAGLQGKYYEYHDKLFENQQGINEELLVKIAQDLGLNMDKFNKDRASDKVATIVQEDAKQANDLGLNGTPGFVLNGVKIKGAYPQEHFEKVIDALGVG